MTKFYPRFFQSSNERVTNKVTKSYLERNVTSRTTKDGDFIGKTVEYVEVDPSKRYEGIKCSDFSLENILAAGAYDLLKQAQLTDTKLNIAAKLEDGAFMVNEYLDAVDAKNNEVKNDEE